MKAIRMMVMVVAVLVGLELSTTAQQSKRDEGNQTAKIAVTEKGFEPARVALEPDVPARVTFVRQTDKTCAMAVAIPEYKINRELPLNKPVVVEFTPTKAGEFTFTCGMNMLKGTLVVKEGKSS